MELCTNKNEHLIGVLGPVQTPNLIPLIKYMKSSASESEKNSYLNLKWLSHSSRLAQVGIIFTFGTALIQTLKLSCAKPNA